MMIYDEPGMTNEGLTRLGQQLGNLFRQVVIFLSYMFSHYPSLYIVKIYYLALLSCPPQSSDYFNILC